MLENVSSIAGAQKTLLLVCNAVCFCRQSWLNTINVAYDFTKMDINSNRLHFTAFFNQTISGGSDLMFIINFVTNALWRTIISNNTSAYLIAGMHSFVTSLA